MLLTVAALLLALSITATAPALLHFNRAVEHYERLTGQHSRCRIPLCHKRTRDDVCADHQQTTTRF